MNLIIPKLFSSTVISAFTTRYGGVSLSHYESNNLAFHVGDNPIHVIQNHDLLAHALGYDRQQLVHMRQVHSDIIVEVDASYNFETIPECDALITNSSNVPLMIMSADCTPILIHDPLNQAIGVVHAGRAGALNRILQKTLQKMALLYGTDMQHVLIALGPSIHGCCYEINRSIAEEVTKSGYSHALREKDEKVFLDVNTILKNQLEKLFIPEEHIEVIEECTSCLHDRYFSYRADKQKTGRIAGVIMLR